MMGKVKSLFVKILLTCIPFMASALGVSELDTNRQVTSCKECTASASGATAMSALLEQEIKVSSKVRHMEQLEEAIDEQGLKARAYYATTLTPDQFSKAVKSVLVNDDQAMIVQYDQSSVDMHTGVAFALVTNYDKKKDSVQLMSVDASQPKFKWVKSATLVKAMQVLDENRCPKGYLIIRKPLPEEN